ncbi:MAG TPA: porin [Bradyrhizobium sp.]|nr:porin [Bradyrhizobium sp.]
MRTFVLAMLIAVLSASSVLAASAGHPKLDTTTPPDRLPPPKRATGNPCAAYGAGFVKVEGTDTCMRIGGSLDVGIGGAVRPR